jgi:hypothetical protein
MFRKIHSNRDPGHTLFSELAKELNPYFLGAGQWLRGFAGRYPQILFAVMVLAILVSLALSFTVLRAREPGPGNPAKGMLYPVGAGFSQILQAGSELRETLALKRQVDSIAGKKTLSAHDSLVLEKALDRLRQISKPLKNH